MRKSTQSTVSCPRCDHEGKAVKPITLQALLLKETLDVAGNIEDQSWRFCQTPTCPVVYFEETGSALFEKQALTVRVGIKETAAPRPVCYCFHHSVEEIEDDIVRTGRTGVVDDIRTRMKIACWCETKNPMGSCCLGTVTRFVKAAQARSGKLSPQLQTADEPDCCSIPDSQPASPERSLRSPLGAWATFGAVISSVFSSACCWLPLLLLAFGMSAAGVAGFFETWRPWFLTGAIVLLALGFYLSYFRKVPCLPGSTCAVLNPRLRGFQRAMLWIATVFIAAFALFPNYHGFIIASGGGAAIEETWTSAAITLRIRGMTCEACAITLQKKLSTLPGVARATVDYKTKRAIVLPTEDRRLTRELLSEAVEDSGYRIKE